MKDLIGRRERVILTAERELMSEFERLDKSLLRRLLAFLNELDRDNDNLTFSGRNVDLLVKFRNDLSKYLNSEIRSSEISQSLIKISASNIELAKAITDVAVTPSLISPLQSQFIDVVTDRISAYGGILKADVSNVLFRHVGLGSTLSESVRDVTSLLEGTDSARYSKQIAVDTIWQYDGMVQKQLSEKLNLDAFMFVGSVIETSREGCIHMVNAPKPVEICTGKGEKRKCVTKQNRFKDIFLESGGFRVDDIPFIIEMNENDGGWNPETTPENYLSLRNGFNCRHQTVTYKMNRDEARVNKLHELYDN